MNGNSAPRTEELQYSKQVKFHTRLYTICIACLLKLIVSVIQYVIIPEISTDNIWR